MQPRECGILNTPTRLPPRSELRAASTDSVFVRAMPALFVVLWSSGFIVSKLGAQYATPLTFLAWRYALTLLLLLPIIWIAGARWPAPQRLTGHIAVAGVLVHAGYLGGVWSAIYLGMPAGLAALIVGLQPILTALAGPWLGERVGMRQWVGFLLGFAGVAMVVANKITWGGDIGGAAALSVFALFSITAGTLYQKRFCPSFDLRTGTFVQYAACLLVTIPAAIVLEDGRVDPGPPLYFALGWSAVVLSLGAIWLLFMLIRRGAATRVVSLFYLTPPTTALMAWALFGESLSPLGVLGMAVAVLGVALVVRRAA